MGSLRTAAGVVGAGVLLCLATGAPASAHVTVPEPGTKGGYSIVSLSVPNERSDAATTTVEVQLPKDQTIASVSAEPKPGWTISTTMRKLDEPVSDDDGTVSEVVDTVKWSGGTVDPGQFDQFTLSMGPLPEDVDSLALPTIQTYSDGDEVRWVDPTPPSGEEPEHPAPTLQLVAGPIGGDEGAAPTATSTTTAPSASTTAPDTATDDGSAAGAAAPPAPTDQSDDGNGLATAALVVAVIALAAGVGAFLYARRAPRFR